MTEEELNREIKLMMCTVISVYLDIRDRSPHLQVPDDVRAVCLRELLSVMSAYETEEWRETLAKLEEITRRLRAMANAVLAWVSPYATEDRPFWRNIARFARTTNKDLDRIAPSMEKLVIKG